MNNAVTIYGIKNCDTVKKALKFLINHSISYEFIDYREKPISQKQYEGFKKAVGIEVLVNRRSTTYRSLSENEKQSIDFELISKYPTLIKRPVLIKDEKVVVGFNEKKYLDFLL
ncbi:MAG: Spx/MgsR family RNA polymerase-binding regulatory protein [Candidatus Thioglobus sp.]|jgi:arsenate reductase|nr:Spx/MgsR family RNA polymerase-binding regulatory protein [Candidatus Thioglobus sp.]